jgi:hypothetical protein
MKRRVRGLFDQAVMSESQLVEMGDSCDGVLDKRRESLGGGY